VWRTCVYGRFSTLQPPDVTRACLCMMRRLRRMVAVRTRLWPTEGVAGEFTCAAAARLCLPLGAQFAVDIPASTTVACFSHISACNMAFHALARLTGYAQPDDDRLASSISMRVHHQPVLCPLCHRRSTLSTYIRHSMRLRPLGQMALGQAVQLHHWVLAVHCH
jgi:hypothetical protein